MPIYAKTKWQGIYFQLHQEEICESKYPALKPSIGNCSSPFAPSRRFPWPIKRSSRCWSLPPASRVYLTSSGRWNGLSWFLIEETLRAFWTPSPLYSVLNEIFKERRADFAAATFQTGLCIFLLYTLFSAGVLAYGAHLIRLMSLAEIGPGILLWHSLFYYDRNIIYHCLQIQLLFTVCTCKKTK